MMDTPPSDARASRSPRWIIVTREPNPRDGRGTLARVTEQGREVVDKVTGELMAADFGLGALDDDERMVLVDVLRSIRLSAGDFRE